MNKKFIIANWKMNPQSLAEVEDILSYVDEHLRTIKENPERSIVICPPFIFVEDVGRIMSQSQLFQWTELGAQDIALADSGAWTGEVSGRMLKRLGVKYIIIGHSERRWKMGEDDVVVNKKLKTALADGFIPIVCIGERERNESSTDFIREQIKNTFKDLSSDEINRCLIAYEPVWAISSNLGAEPEKPEDTLKAIATIKETLGSETRVLYGGSVNPNNAKEFLSLDEISGVLVGGASIKKEDFVQILNSL